MSTLREDLAIEKKHRENIINKAAINWLAENVIIINEKLDRKTVTRLVDSIQKFEDTFGSYKEKIPSIGAHLDAAEMGLEMVITGKTKSGKASGNLKQLSYLYSTLSNFFTRDLPILLKTGIFKAAKNQPKQPINSLPSLSQDGVKHNIQVVHDALANAISPSKEEKKLLGKIYRETKLPKLNVNKMSTELLALTFEDLEELTKIGKVPMVTTPEDDGENEETAAATPVEKPEETPETATESKYTAEVGEILLEEATISTYLLTEASTKELGAALNKVGEAIRAGGLKELEAPFSELHSEVLKVFAGDKSALNQAKQTGFTDFFKSKSGILLKQANMFIETIKALGNSWDSVKDLVEKPNPTEVDLKNILGMVTKGLQGGFLKRLGGKFKTSPFPGLEPEKIVKSLTMAESKNAKERIAILEKKILFRKAGGSLREQIADSEKAAREKLANQAAAARNARAQTKAKGEIKATQKTAMEKSAPAVEKSLEKLKTSELTKKLESLKKAMTSLQSFATPPPTKGPESPTQAAPAAQSQAAPAAQSQAAPAAQKNNDNGKLGMGSLGGEQSVSPEEVSKAFPNSSAKKTKRFMKNLEAKGFRIVRK